MGHAKCEAGSRLTDCVVVVEKVDKQVTVRLHYSIVVVDICSVGELIDKLCEEGGHPLTGGGVLKRVVKE
jgi:hypothetical protein